MKFKLSHTVLGEGAETGAYDAQDTCDSRQFLIDEVQSMIRKSRWDLYLDVAEAMLGRATCLRRVYGAVIVKNDEIISTGYNGAPRGVMNCTDRGTCKREELNIPQGQRYELCCAVHAEANAIISAARKDMIDSTLFLVGKDARTGKILNVSEPCEMCKRMIINAGIKYVVTRNKEDFGHYEVIDWVKHRM